MTRNDTTQEMDLINSGYKFSVEIKPDIHPPLDPREHFDNVGVFNLSDPAGRYNLANELDNWDGTEGGEPAAAFDVFMYEHGGVHLFTKTNMPAVPGAHLRFDVRPVGQIAISREAAIREWGGGAEGVVNPEQLPDGIKALAHSCLLAELSEYSAFLNGDVFAFFVKDEETDETVDSCGGFYSYDHAYTEGIGSALYHTKAKALAAYEAASRVLDHSPETTQEDVGLAQEAGLITFEIDIDGYYPEPTEKYNEETERIHGRIDG